MNIKVPDQDKLIEKINALIKSKENPISDEQKVQLKESKTAIKKYGISTVLNVYERRAIKGDTLNDISTRLGIRIDLVPKFANHGSLLINMELVS